MDEFILGNSKILIGTDVIGRGIDFPNVSIIINYDTPKNVEDYIHRIGRTGRCGNKGLSVSFINEKCKPIINDLHEILLKHSIDLPISVKNMYYENNREKYGNFDENINESNKIVDKVEDCSFEYDFLNFFEEKEFILKGDYFYRKSTLENQNKFYNHNNFQNSLTGGLQLYNTNDFFVKNTTQKIDFEGNSKMSWRK